MILREKLALKSWDVVEAASVDVKKKQPGLGPQDP